MVAERVAFGSDVFVPLGDDAARDLLDEERRWIDPAGRKLSDRIWRARAETRRAIDEALLRGIATGADPLVLADELEQWLRPELRPQRDAAGDIVPGQARRIATSAPYPAGTTRVLGGRRPAMGSYPARRLARTEVTRAFGLATVRAAALNPFVKGIRWRLSGRHPKADACDPNAGRDTEGLGVGVYSPGNVPRYPAHPACICALLPAAIDDPEAVVAQLRRDLALDQPAPIRPGSAVLTPIRRESDPAALLGALFRAFRLLSEAA